MTEPSAGKTTQLLHTRTRSDVPVLRVPAEYLKISGRGNELEGRSGRWGRKVC